MNSCRLKLHCTDNWAASEVVFGYLYLVCCKRQCRVGLQNIDFDKRVFINLTQSVAEAHFQFCYDYELMPESDIWWWWWWLCGEIVVTSIGKCLAPGQGCVCGLAPGVRRGQGRILWDNENLSTLTGAFLLGGHRISLSHTHTHRRKATFIYTDYEKYSSRGKGGGASGLFCVCGSVRIFRWRLCQVTTDCVTSISPRRHGTGQGYL